MTAITLWGIGALYFSPLLAARWRALAAASYGSASILAFALLPYPGRTAIAALAIFAVLVILFRRIPASNDRDWQPDVAVTPRATVNGELVTIHGVRNFAYRTETDFDARWEDRTYDLSKLDSVDLIAAYWTGKAVAHIMVSFGFHDQDYLAVSIETRKEKGESYSTSPASFANTSFTTSSPTSVMRSASARRIASRKRMFTSIACARRRETSGGAFSTTFRRSTTCACIRAFTTR